MYHYVPVSTGHLLGYYPVLNWLDKVNVPVDVQTAFF
jgi:hypothetical protein